MNNDYAKRIAEAVREAAAKAVTGHDRNGRDWIAGSLWDTLSNEASARIRSLDLDAIIASVPGPQQERLIFVGALCTPKSGGKRFAVIDRHLDSWELRECDIEMLYATSKTPKPKESHEQD